MAQIIIDYAEYQELLDTKKLITQQPLHIKEVYIRDDGEFMVKEGNTFSVPIGKVNNNFNKDRFKLYLVAK